MDIINSFLRKNTIRFWSSLGIFILVIFLYFLALLLTDNEDAIFAIDIAFCVLGPFSIISVFACIPFRFIYNSSLRKSGLNSKELSSRLGNYTAEGSLIVGDGVFVVIDRSVRVFSFDRIQGLRYYKKDTKYSLVKESNDNGVLIVVVDNREIICENVSQGTYEMIKEKCNV